MIELQFNTWVIIHLSMTKVRILFEYPCSRNWDIQKTNSPNRELFRIKII
jgi:hypothetical protein